MCDILKQRFMRLRSFTRKLNSRRWFACLAGMLVAMPALAQESNAQPATSSAIQGEALADALDALRAAGIQPPAPGASVDAWQSLSVEVIPLMLAKIWKPGVDFSPDSSGLRDKSAGRVVELAYKVACKPDAKGNPGLMRPGVAKVILVAWQAAEARGDKDARNGLRYFLYTAAMMSLNDAAFLADIRASLKDAGPIVQGEAPKLVVIGIFTRYRGRVVELLQDIDEHEKEADRVIEKLAKLKVSSPPQAFKPIESQLLDEMSQANDLAAKKRALMFSLNQACGPILGEFGKDAMLVLEANKASVVEQANAWKNKNDSQKYRMCTDLVNEINSLIFMTSLRIQSNGANRE